MSADLAKTLKKQISDLEAKGAQRTKHETLTLENTKVKLRVMQKAMKEASK